MKRFCAFWSLLFLCSLAFAGGEKLSRQSYIEQWKDEAIYQMATYGIPASITLAQGILESGDGNSDLAAVSNNHFGIKCHSDWSGKKTYHDDDKKGECFRVYPTAHQSFEDHSLFLKRKRYERLFELKTSDYKGWAKGLKKCGYATNPKYPSLLIRIIEQNNLTEYDKIGLKMIKKGEVPERNIEKKTGKKRKNAQKKENDNQVEVEDLGETIIAATGKAGSNKRSHSIKMSTHMIKYVIAKEGDSFESLTEELQLMQWQLPKYNDLPPNAQLEEGQVIYLQPKRRRGKVESHTLKEGDTLWSVSQRHGIKMKHLLRINGLDGTASPPVGTSLKLR